MVDITDPQVINFANDHLRPRAEQIRNLLMLLTDDATEYTTIIAPLLVPHVNDDVLLDGRAADGVTPVTKQKLANLITLLGNVKDELEAVGADALMAEFSVRPPKVSN